MYRNIQCIVLCLIAALVYTDHTVAAAQHCKISVVNNNASGDKATVAVFNGGDSLAKIPLKDTGLANGKTWHTQCYGGAEKICKIKWMTQEVINSTHTREYASYKFVGVACGSTYKFTAEASGLNHNIKLLH